MSVGLVIVAAGNGTRMGSKVRKPYIQIGGVPILILALNKFLAIPSIKEIVLVVHQEEMEQTNQLLDSHQISSINIVSGGVERQESVAKGVRAISDHIEYVLIHDGARPFVSTTLILKLIEEVKQKKAIIPAIPVKDTIKIIEEQGIVTHTPDRRSLWAAQTPQAFSLSMLRSALKEAKEKGLQGTDDASILEMMGYPVYIIEGESTNIKITTPEDLLMGEVVLRRLEGK